MTVRRAVPALVIAVLVAVALGSVAVTLVGLHRDPAPVVVTDPPPPAESRPEVAAAEVLAAWDAERAAAWADGDVRRLRSLYTAGSVAGDRDVAMLRALARPGPRRPRPADPGARPATGEPHRRTAGSWRSPTGVAGGVATVAGASTALPADARDDLADRDPPSCRGTGGWSRQSPMTLRPARSTSATSRSWNS